MADISISEVRQKFPQYDDLSDLELAQALHGAYYADLPFDEFAKSIGVKAPTAGDQALADLTRGTGIAARDAIMGGLGLPLMIGDALNSGIDFVSGQANQRLGTNFPQLGSPSTYLESKLDEAGYPRPEGRLEEGLSAVNRIAAGAGVTKGVADLLNKAAPPLTEAGKTILNLFRTNPAAQILPGATSVLATDQARNTFGVENPMALAGIGLGTGMTTGGATTAGKEIIKGVVQPFTTRGRQIMVGNTLNRLANNPEAAQINLGNSREVIPGVRSTTAAAARDPGLAGAETPIRAIDDTNEFGLRITQNNRARMNELDRIAGNPGKLQQAIDKRARITAPLREQAFANSVVDDAQFKTLFGNVTKTIDDIAASPSGKRMGVEQALNFARDRLSRATNPRELYEVRKDLAQAASGGYESTNPGLRLASGQLKDVIRSIDNTLEATAPGFKEYMQKFSTMSKPIDQMKLLQDVRNKVTRGQTDVINNQPVITASSLRNQVASRMDELNDTLSPTQRKVLDKIALDIDRGMASTAPGIKPPGSDTFKNMSTANLIGRVFSEGMTGNATLRTFARPLDFLFKLPDDKLKALLVEAMLDPKLASQLMAKASLVRMPPVAEQLRQKAIAMGYGAAIGAEK